MKIKTYIVDDEPYAIELLRSFVLQVPELELCGAETDPCQLISVLSSAHPPGLLFADIEMPGLSGISLAKLTAKETQIVFTTSFPGYGVEAFGVRALDYLLKPLIFERFLESVRRLSSSSSASTQSSSPVLLVRTGIRGQLQQVPVEQILYLESMEHYLRIQLRESSIMAHTSMVEALAHPALGALLRVHRSFAVHPAYIQLIEPGQVKLKNGTSIPIGRAYREDMNRYSSRHLLG